MFFALYGDDTYRSRKKLAALRERFCATRDASGMNAQAVRAEQGVDAAAEALFASPFLADRKLVVLEGFCALPAKEQERMREILGRKPESTNAIFFESESAETLAKSTLFSLIKAQKYSEQFSVFTGAEAERFAIEECAAKGVVLAPAAARALASSGPDTWRLHQEIEKLCAHAAANGKSAIDEESVRLLSNESRDDSIFAFLDACMERRGADAGSLLERLLASGISELQLVAMLQKHFRTLLAVRDLIDRGERDKFAIAKRLGIHSFSSGKAIAAARRHSPAAIRFCERELLEIERAAKSGGKPKPMLGVFTAKLAAAL